MQFPNLRHRLFQHRRFRQLLIGSLITSLVLGVVIVPIEARGPSPTIQNLSDGLWWAVQTLTTVGYGDVSPKTDLGRGMGVIMQLLGAVMFGALIALVGSTMSRGQEEFYWTRLFERLDKLEERMEKIEKYSGYVVREQQHEENMIRKEN